MPSLRRRIGPLLLAGPLVFCGAAVVVMLTAVHGPAPGSAAVVLALAACAAVVASPFALATRRMWPEATRGWLARAQLAAGVAALIAILACDRVASRSGFPGRLVQAVDLARVGGYVDLTAVEATPWSRMLVFGWYAQRRTVECALGDAWDDDRADSVAHSESHNLVVFVDAEGRVLEASELPRGTIDFCDKVHFLEVPRAEARLEVKSGKFDPRCLAARVVNPDPCAATRAR